MLVINNLAASSLWHKLACVDPPPNLLANIQAQLVDFFWDGLHWIPQSVLHLPKEEGGQGLVQLSSRAAAFRLQFIQRLLTGPRDLVWRAAASGLLHTVKGLGLDRALFLMDTKMLDISGLPMFYRGLFKIWNVFKKQNKGCRTVHWLLEEPLVYSRRLDISGVTVPALSRTLVSSGIVTLRELVNVAGSDLSRAEDLAARMGLRSRRVVNQLLHRWSSALTSEERVQLMGYQHTETGPAEDEPFPRLNIAPDLDGCAGPLLECRSDGEMDFGSVSGKLLYRACVKVLNKKKLSGRVDTPWRSVLGFSDDVKPEWRALYKPPLTKRAADLQWRILHAYTNIPGAYRAESRPHLGYSDHISVILIPACRPLIRRSKTVLKQVRTWQTGAISALQDCFECTDWSMFMEAATNSDSINLEENTTSVTSYIGKCIDDMTISKTITTRSNQKPWMTAKVRALLKSRDSTFRAEDKLALKTARAKLS
ncbi:hypothetical protein QTP70_000457 [Hemibagrus guttatus]|uniref:Uncharacterized protein n=1 Tax=Hemibagrus guttatus TaxID=175788 RepID=A0AAE0QN46_9TELE|nr:hypothetical protein QTP70_000457 [Hemibagrus guttatus]KAK3558015.1 hypothetical protein QTP86_005836 [Hemibagrus guttatus]